MVAINIDPKQMKRLEKALVNIKGGVPKVLSPAINRTLNKGRTEVKREIRKRYVIKAKDIPFAVIGSTTSRLSGEIRIKQGMLDLNKFKISPKGVQRRKTKKIIHATVRVGGGGDIPHGFVAAVGSYTGPFTRKGAGALPIRKRLTIGAGIMASQPAVGPAVQKAMEDMMAKRLDHELQRVLAKG